MYKMNRLKYLMILAVIILILPTTHVSAALSRCRGDPIFALSNGDILTVMVDISADPAQINNVTYILHVPPGVTIKQVTHTSRGFGIREIYKVYQDSPARTYITDTVVTMQSTTAAVAVTVYTRLNGVFTEIISGYSGQNLIITISRW